MEKVYFRDNEKVTILSVINIMANCGVNLSDEIIIDDEKLDSMRKSFIEIYSNTQDNNEAELAVKIVEKYNECEELINLDNIKQFYVEKALYKLKSLQNMTQQQKNIENRIETIMNNLFIYNFIYEYLEENLKKVIVSEFFKRLFLNKPYNLDISIKITYEILDRIFKNKNIKNKEEFFCQQLRSWLIYNNIISITKYEIKNREDDSNKKDIFINIDFFKKLHEIRIN